MAVSWYLRNFTESVRNSPDGDAFFAGRSLTRSSSRIGLNRNGKSPSMRMKYIEHFLDGDWDEEQNMHR